VAVKGKKKKQAMGDDPLMWMKYEVSETDTLVSGARQPPKAAKQRVRKKSNSKHIEKASSEESGERRDEKHIVLDPVLAIDNAKKLYEQLDSVVQKKQNVIIDASAVEMIDTAMLQLLIAFIRKLQNEGAKISWNKPSKELLSRAVLLNLEGHLGIV